MKYILLLRYYTMNVEQLFYEDRGNNKFDVLLFYNRRPVWYRKKACGHKGNFVYMFRGEIRKAELVERYMVRTENN